MAALEYRIISKILTEQDIGTALKVGLTEESFKDAEARQIWRYLRKHWYDRATTKTLPSLRTVQRVWPAFRIAPPLPPEEDANLTALIHDLKTVSLESDIRALANYFQELANEDPEEAIRTMQAHLTDLTRQSRHTQHLGVREVIENAKEHYASAKDGLVYGLSWPWECLTEDTLGKRPGDLIVMYARMKSMKTWVMLFNAVHDYLVNNARVLVWSREMNKEKMCLRLASLFAKVDYQLFKKGGLPRKVRQRAWATFEQLKEEGSVDGETAHPSNRRLILLCGREAPKELEKLQGYIQEYDPDVAYLDSFYHLESASMKGVTQRWHRLAVLSEDIKSMAEDEGIPIIAVHQANRAGEKTYGNTMSDLADSDVLAREADLIIRINKRRGKELDEEDYEGEFEQEKVDAEKRKEEYPKLGGRPKLKLPRAGKKLPPKVEEEARRQELEKEETPRIGAELALVLPGNREGVLEAFTIHAVPGYNFDLISSDYNLAQIEEWIGEGTKTTHTKKPDKPQFSEGTFKKWKSLNTKPKVPRG